MEDEKIVALYWSRDEKAIEATQTKYDRYLYKIAHNILCDREDSLESVNDTYMKAWTSMPPNKPSVLSTYLGKITRTISIDMVRWRLRKKRKASEYVISLSELSDCVSGGDTTMEEVQMHLLGKAINDYVRSLSSEARDVFVGRYYFMDSLNDVAAYHGMSISKVKSMLFRTRKGLKEHLIKEGFVV